MLDYMRERAREVLRSVRSVVFATSGPAGVQASEFPCEAAGLDLYLLVPQTSDHLFNIEKDARVALTSDEWELKGQARALSPEEQPPELSRFRESGSAWDVLIHIRPTQIQIRRKDGWGAAETFDLAPGE